MTLQTLPDLAALIEPFEGQEIAVCWLRGEIEDAASPTLACFEETKTFTDPDAAIMFAREQIARGEVWSNTVEMRVTQEPQPHFGHGRIERVFDINPLHFIEWRRTGHAFVQDIPKVKLAI